MNKNKEHLNNFWPMDTHKGQVEEIINALKKQRTR